MREPVEMIGLTFGRFKVLSLSSNKSGKRGRLKYFCECLCGVKKDVIGEHLRTGHIVSCGCKKKERFSGKNNPSYKHGLSKDHPLYNIWENIKSRCLSPADPGFKDYGGRGIIMDSKWRENFAYFLKDIIEKIGERPSKQHSLDRINVNGNYEITNVRWATSRQQATNKRNSRSVTGRLTGVYQDKGTKKYRICVHGYVTEEEAHEAYLLAVKNLEASRCVSQ